MPPTALVPGETVRIRDERWIVIRQTRGADASVLEVRGRDRSNRETRAAFLLPFERVERLGADRSARRVAPGRWRLLARAMLSEATPSWQSLRTALRARISLLPFQLEPALAVTHGMAARILIADEVGLGKTIQAALVIAEILERTLHGRAIVVAPAALVDQWQAELGGRFGLDAWHADSGSVARAGGAWGAVNPWAGRPVTIASIDFVKRPEVMRSLEGLVWDAVIFDEAHGLSGRSDRALAAGALARRARTVVLLTATPHSGDDRAFDALRGIGDLGREFPLLAFRRTRQDLGLAVSRRTSSIRLALGADERAMHRALDAYARTVRAERGHGADPAHLVMAVLARRACSSAWSLARSIERRIALLGSDNAPALAQLRLPLFELCADEEPGPELSAPGLDDRNEERRWLEHILALALRAERGESKLRVLTRLLRRVREPTIVFTEYRDTLTRIAAALQHLAPVSLHGGLTATERRDRLKAFQTGTARLLLATDAASEGLNLQQRCRLVINLELPWTPLRLEQRVGRVERIGQSRRVHAVHLLATGTAEESYVRTLQVRTDRAAGALGDLHDQRGAMLDLRACARAETERLERLRAFSPDGHLVADDRPPVTQYRRHRGDRDLWGFRFGFTNAFGHVVWQTLIGAFTPARSSSLPIDEVDEAGRLIAAILDESRDRDVASLERSLHAHLDLAFRRERAIAGALAEERARLAAPLLQRGLFDRRAERAQAAREAVLDEALRRCHARLDEVASTRRIAAEPRRLAFALIRR